jgi:hypothetical protein
MPNSTKASSTDNIDPLLDIFTMSSTNKGESNVPMTTLEKDLETAFSPSNANNPTANTNNVLSNDKIMALYKTPQISTATASAMNIRPATIQPPNSIYLNLVTDFFRLLFI